MSYPFILLQTPYNFPATGSCIINNTGGLTFGATDPNVFANGSFTNSQGFYWNEIDSDGIDRSSYFDQFLDQDITITMDQAGVVVIYNGDTNSIGTWSSGTSSGYVFGSKVQLSPGVFTGTASLIQSATSSWTYNVPVYVSITGSMSTTTTTTTQEPTTTTTTTTEEPTTTTSTTTTAPSENLLNCYVYYNNSTGTDKSLLTHNFYFYENWIVSSTYSGYSYSFGQKPIGLTAYDSFIINSTGSSTFSYFTISVFTYSGDIFTIYASTNQPTKGYNSVDALKIARYFTGGVSFSETQKKVADVNATGIINSTDALRIQQRFVNLSSTFAKGDWTLFPMTFSLSELAATSSGYILTITISCVGDVG
ncbi:hypothetical protein EBU71_03415 [bacterium]|nr:hypothetical protein [Candidatus Elulimicrobium humile]